MTAADPRLRRLGEVVGAVARDALAGRGAGRVALLDDGGLEAALAARLLEGALGPAAVIRATAAPPEVESLLLHAGPDEPGEERIAEELRRLRARLVPGALPAHPANKTALLLGGELPPEPLLPLGDLWASEVAEMEGGWSAPPAVRRLAEAAGGIEVLDAALRGWIEGRNPAALQALPGETAREVRAAFAAGRASRLFPRVVPKLGTRTLCLDLFE